MNFYALRIKKNGHWIARSWDQQFQTFNTTTSQKKETKIVPYAI